MDNRQIIVTGCPRSGTEYTATLARKAGVAAVHETSFEWTRDFKRLVPSPGWEDGTVRLESSYKCAPFAAEFAAAGVRVVHLVRAPLDMISSVLAIANLPVSNRKRAAAFQDWKVNRAVKAPWFDFLRTHYPDMTWVPPGPDRVAMFWVYWNRLAAAGAEERWLLHEGIPADALVDAGAKPDAAGRALALLPKRVGTSERHARGGEQVQLDDLSPSVRGEVVELCAEYGLPVTAP